MKMPSLKEKVMALSLTGVAGLLVWLSVGVAYMDQVASFQQRTDILLDEAALLSARAQRLEQSQSLYDPSLNRLVLIGAQGSGLLQLQDVISSSIKGKDITLASLEPLAVSEGDERSKVKLRLTGTLTGIQSLLHSFESRGTDGSSGPLIRIERLSIRKALSSAGRVTRPLDCEIVIAAGEVGS